MHAAHPTLVRLQAVEVPVKFLNFFGSHRGPIATPTDLNNPVSNQRVLSVGEGSMLEADSRSRGHGPGSAASAPHLPPWFETPAFGRLLTMRAERVIITVQRY